MLRTMIMLGYKVLLSARNNGSNAETQVTAGMQVIR